MALVFDDLSIDFTRFTFNNSIALATALAIYLALRAFHSPNTRVRTPKLASPPSQSYLFGATKDIFNAPDVGNLFADWERQYGAVYEIASGLGSRMIVLGDPKGVAHFFANDTTTYHHLSFVKNFSRFFGENLVIPEGDAHKRQRRAMSSGFSISTIRNLTPVFLDCAEKLTLAWNFLLESKGPIDTFTVDVQKWMNYVSLDSVGKAAFSYEFKSLAGGQSPVMDAIDSLGSVKPTFSVMIFLLLGPLFPTLVMKLPTERTKALTALSNSAREIAGKLIAKEQGENPDVMDKSILSALLKSETGSANACMSIEEIMSQQLVMMAGYETTAITLTWALIELSRNPLIQKTLRDELKEQQASAGEEITHDRLMNNLPYLDAFICEVLRLHPAIPDLTRVASKDDSIPLSKPITTASGTVVESLSIAKGTMVRVPIIAINRSESLWGPDASVFDPTRWLGEEPGELYDRRKETINGYRHLLSFIHGPRVCIGRNFALTEIKAVLWVLVRNFTFEFPGGPETKLGTLTTLTLRPKVAGEEGSRVPLVIRKVSVD